MAMQDAFPRWGHGCKGWLAANPPPQCSARPAATPPDARLVVLEVAAGGAHEAFKAGKGQGVVLKQLHKYGGQVRPARRGQTA